MQGPQDPQGVGLRGATSVVRLISHVGTPRPTRCRLTWSNIGCSTHLTCRDSKTHKVSAYVEQHRLFDSSHMQGPQDPQGVGLREATSVVRLISHAGTPRPTRCRLTWSNIGCSNHLTCRDPKTHKVSAYVKQHRLFNSSHMQGPQDPQGVGLRGGKKQRVAQQGCF